MYNVEHPNRKVYNHPELFVALRHDMPFAADNEINNALKLFFYNWSMCYDDVNICSTLMQNFVTMQRDYWLQLYRTTTYDYDPLKNYDMTEEHEYSEEEASSRSSTTYGKSDNKNYEKPLDTSAEKERSQNTTTQDSTGEDEEGRIRTYRTVNRKYGDASLRSVPEFIKIERETCISLLNNYVQSFKRFFYLDM